MKRYSYYMFFTILIITTCLIVLITKESYSLPTDNNIIKVNSELEVAKYTNTKTSNNYIEINTETGLTSGASFTELAKGKEYKEVIDNKTNITDKKELIEDYLLEDGRYAIKETNDNSKIEVLSIYSNKRLRVDTNDKNINTYGAKTAVYYNNSYTLTYKNELDCKNAYDNLKKDYGNKVIIDLPLEENSIKGWGTYYMQFNNKLLNINPSNNIIVAVLDSGIEPSHEIFNNINILEGVNMINGSMSAQDDFGHGTAVSGIIAESVKGANISILPIKVLNNKGAGSLLNILNSLEYAKNQGAKVANLSLAINFANYYNSDEIQSTMKYYDNILAKSPLLMICASGNDNVNQDNAYSYPSVSNYTISVGSINEDEKRSSFSNYGKTLDFVAPGSDINVARPNTSSCVKNCYKQGSGTSFSAPYISAAASLVLVDHPEYQNRTVKNYLISISKDLGAVGKDIEYGFGVPIFNKDPKEFSDEKFIENYTATLSNYNYKYDGTYKKPSVTLIYNNKIIDKNNYNINYSNNLNTGTGLVIITGKNDYYGTIVKSFNINKTKINGNIHLNKTKYAYTGKKIKPTITLTNSRGVVVQPNNYYITYSNNKNIGKATITIKGKKNYNGYITKTFKIVPKKVKVKKINKNNNRVYIKWKKISGSPTYQIKYKKGSKWKYKYTKKNYINIKINKNTTIKVRAIKKVSNKKYYGIWSKKYKI